nr:MAG TPA: hypothetical protein [Caudoviricetes sp.]
MMISHAIRFKKVHLFLYSTQLLNESKIINYFHLPFRCPLHTIIILLLARYRHNQINYLVLGFLTHNHITVFCTVSIL